MESGFIVFEDIFSSYKTTFNVKYSFPY